MTIKPCAFALLIVVSASPAMAQLQQSPEAVTLIHRAPHIDTEAEGCFTVQYNKATNKIVIDGNVARLSSPLIVPTPAAQTEIHLHHFQMLDQPRPPIIEALKVVKEADGRAATFHGEFSLDSSKQYDTMFLSGMTFVLVHTTNFPKGEVVGYIDFGDASGALDWNNFQEDHPLIRQYRQINRYPVLPISRSQRKETDDAPFPTWTLLKDNPQFLDTRSGNGVPKQTDKERYLRDIGVGRTRESVHVRSF